MHRCPRCDDSNKHADYNKPGDCSDDYSCDGYNDEEHSGLNLSDFG